MRASTLLTARSQSTISKRIVYSILPSDVNALYIIQGKRDYNHFVKTLPAWDRRY